MISVKILVFVKQVPDTVDVQIDPATGNICREGIQSVINPYDANAIEAALCHKEKLGATVAAVSMGPPQAMDVLNYALGMGCDECYLLSDRAFGGADTLATGYALSKAAEKIGDYDLLIFGKCATDAETAQTGPIVAEFLDIPQVTLVDKLDIEDGWAVCRRDLGSSFQTVKAKLPSLVTVTAEINTPRYPSARGIMTRGRKPHYTWTAEEAGCDTNRTGGKGSPSVNKKIFAPPKHSTDTQYFSGEPEEIAKAFVDALEAEKII